MGRGANSRKMLSLWSYRDGSAGPFKPKKIPASNTESKAPTSFGVPVILNRSDDEIILPGSLAHAYRARVTFAPVLSYGHPDLHTPRSGINSRASLKRLVKLAMQIARVSSTIWPIS